MLKMFNFINSKIKKVKIIPCHDIVKPVHVHHNSEKDNNLCSHGCSKNRNKNDDEENLTDIGTYDPLLYDIVKDIRNHLVLNKSQIKHLKSCCKNELVKIIKLLNFCNYMFKTNNDYISDSEKHEYLPEYITNNLRQNPSPIPFEEKDDN